MNLRTGERMGTRFGGREREIEPEPDPFGPATMFFLDSFPGLFNPKIVALALLLAVISAAVAVVFLAIASLGAVFAAFAIGAVALIIWGQALAMILSGEIGFLSSCMIEFDAKRWCWFIIFIVAPVVATFTLVRYVMTGSL